MLSDADREALRTVGCNRHQADSESFICRPCADAEIELVERILAAQRETIATEIEAMRTNCDSGRTVCDYCRGLNDAAAITRSGAR